MTPGTGNFEVQEEGLEGRSQGQRAPSAPRELDKEIARIKPESKEINIHQLAAEQSTYLKSWSEGTQRICRF